MLYNKKTDIIENLRDAGCGEEDIDCFLAEFCSGRKTVGVKRLRAYRRELLERIHDTQKKIDCLDYFLYKLDKNEVKAD